MRDAPLYRFPEGSAVWLGPSPDGRYDLWADRYRSWIYVASRTHAAALSPGRPLNNIYALGYRSSMGRPLLYLDAAASTVLARVGLRRMLARGMVPG